MLSKSNLLERAFAGEQKPVFGMNHFGEIIWLNDACEQILPQVMVGLSVEACLPEFHLEQFQSYLTDQREAVFTTHQSKAASLRIERFFETGKKNPVFVGSYSEGSVYHIEPAAVQNDAVALLARVIRERTGEVLRLIDAIREKNERNFSAEEMGLYYEIDDSCRGLLQLCYLFGELNRPFEPEHFVCKEQRFYSFFSELMNKCSLLLRSTGLSFHSETDHLEGLVLLDEERFSIAVMNFIRVAATVEGEREFFWRTDFSEQEVMLTLRILGISKDDILIPREDVLLYQSNSPIPHLKKVSWEILLGVVEGHEKGSCQIFDAPVNGRNGIQIIVRFPATPVILPFEVREPVGYTAPRRLAAGLARLDLTRIMLGDLVDHQG